MRCKKCGKFMKWEFTHKYDNMNRNYDKIYQCSCGKAVVSFWRYGKNILNKWYKDKNSLARDYFKER